MRLLSCCSRTVRVNLQFTRGYQSDGVFGYKPKIFNQFNVKEEILAKRSKNGNFQRFVDAYRTHGHRIANVNPVAFNQTPNVQNELDPTQYALNNKDQIEFDGILNTQTLKGSIEDAVDYLKKVYSSSISAEFMFLETEEEREWFAGKMEELPNQEIDKDTKKNIAVELLKSQAFDHYLASKFPGVKRYGGEGAESMMAFFSEFFKMSSEDNIEQIVIAMPHRGRLNFLTGMLNFPPVKMFAKLKGLPDFPTKFDSTGDVLSHVISSTDLSINDRNLHVTMLYNPSHLEAVNPVSMGKARAKYLYATDGNEYKTGDFGEKIVNIQVHGDAAFAGQGINQETLAISNAPHYEIGGSVHLVVNNQVGFTTPGARGRSSMYCTDLAKMIAVPVIHVNGDYPEEVLKATRIAFEYQRKFRKDVFVDMNCYRQWGHNELDDPTFTNPAQYKMITNRKTVPDKYAEKIVSEGIMTQEECTDLVKSRHDWLNEQLKNAESNIPEDPCFKKQWTGFTQAKNEITTWDTGISKQVQKFIGEKSISYPDNLKVHPNLLKNYINARRKRLESGENIDWATAESLALGSLIYQGYNVRIAGQDVGRATFSHRHCMLVDQDTNMIHIPFNHIDANQTGYLEVANSILSEEAVLAFEYGMSVEHPNNLIIWEAQFGDFFNTAQVIFDTFIASGECKWLWSSGITILLPHGYDGAGPEHSSCRLERFLQLTDSKEDRPDGDNVNMQVCQPSTPAQYFHLLRRQMVRNFRKPLIIVTPKTLLRLSDCVSTYEDMQEGTSFQPVLSDPNVSPRTVKKVIFCSGRHYYTLVDKRESLGLNDTALVRIESFCPFPAQELQNEIAKYPNAFKFVWSQEEPRNMGAWSFVKSRMENLVGRKVQYAGRDTLPTPAVGVGKWHQEQVQHVASKPFEL